MGKLMNYVDVITIGIRHGHTEKKTIAALCTLRVANIMLTRTHIIYNFLSNEQENKQQKNSVVVVPKRCNIAAHRNDDSVLFLTKYFY